MGTKTRILRASYCKRARILSSENCEKWDECAQFCCQQAEVLRCTLPYDKDNQDDLLLFISAWAEWQSAVYLWPTWLVIQDWPRTTTRQGTRYCLNPWKRCGIPQASWAKQIRINSGARSSEHQNTTRRRTEKKKKEERKSPFGGPYWLCRSNLITHIRTATSKPSGDHKYTIHVTYYHVCTLHLIRGALAAPEMVPCNSLCLTVSDLR